MKRRTFLSIAAKTAVINLAAIPQIKAQDDHSELNIPKECFILTGCLTGRKIVVSPENYVMEYNLPFACVDYEITFKEGEYLSNELVKIEYHSKEMGLVALTTIEPQIVGKYDTVTVTGQIFIEPIGK